MKSMRLNDCYWAKGDGQDKVYRDSINAINKNKDHMTPEQLKNAVTQMKIGVAPDGYNQLCDRLASNSFQG